MESTALQQNDTLNATTAPAVRLHELRHPTTHNLQVFVDGLVRAYEHGTFTDRVVRMDTVERSRVTVVNLDERDDEPSEDDIMAARIFPATKEELIKQEMRAQLDVAVENYANLIIAILRKLAATLLRTSTVFYVIALKSGAHVRRLAASLQEEMRIEEYARHEASALLRGYIKNENDSMVSVASTAVVPPLQTGMVSAAVLPVPVYTAAPVAPSTVWVEAGEPTPESEDSASVIGVAGALYLQFRYGPKNMRDNK